MSAGDVRLVRAARVVTMAGPDATAFAVRDGRITEVGELAALARRHPAAELVDYGEATVVPAFNDAHVHPSMVAEDLLHLDASAEQVPGRAELIALLSAAAARTPAGQWIRASRYDHTRTTGGVVLDRAELDAVSTTHPILLTHVGAHWGVVNSAGLAAGGYQDASTPPPGGQLGRDGAGRLTGLVGEQALFDYCYPSLARGGRTLIPPSGMSERLRGLARFAELLHAAGIASVTDALCGPRELELYAEARRRGELTLRINALLAHPHLDRFEELAAGLANTEPADRPEPAEPAEHRLRLGGIKAFADGAVAGRTALVEEPFEGTDDHGLQACADEELADLALRCQRAGRRLAVHANGDRAIGKVLAAVEAAQAAAPADIRHRIEHCSIVTPSLLATMRRLDMIAVPFGGYVDYHGEKLLAWYGAARLGRMFAHRWLLDAGIPVAGSSDYPCGPYQPLRAMRSCVTRESAAGVALGVEQRITAREALGLYTTGSAFAAGEAELKGRIAPGFLADFTVLDEDPLRVAPRRLPSVAVRATWVGGVLVWSG
jgi:predicted amidohydrolase YtcJ